VSVDVPYARAEEARAKMLDLFPHGFEEVERADGVELVAYTDASGEERLWQAFGAASGASVADGWEDEWRRFHQPVRVGSLWVGPPWEAEAAGGIAVVVDPGRAFGTGSHPTTRLCLELLQELERGSLLDVGCGSGVLAIAGAKLGFAPVTALDVESPAVEATRANAAANGVDVEALLLNATSDALPPADVCVANITLAAVDAAAPRLRARELVTSGYLDADRPSPVGWRHVERRTTGGWAADRWARA
jgi:ribosomal protein L11 methyltransferase